RRRAAGGHAPRAQDRPPGPAPRTTAATSSTGRRSAASSGGSRASRSSRVSPTRSRGMPTIASGGRRCGSAPRWATVPRGPMLRVDMTRVLVTGAGGQIGHEVVDVCAGDDVIAADHATLDVADRDAVLQAITSVAPDVIIHAGAWTAVDACEGDPERAFRVKRPGTRHVAEGASRVGAWVCYLSTDYVFDGSKPDPYVEWDAPNPVSVYGRSKLGGEWEVAATGAGATIVRTSWVCGLHGGNMVKTILRLAGEH